MNLAVLLLAVAIPVRNPFWPIGHAGTRETITAEPKIQLAATDSPADDTATSVNEEVIAAAKAAEEEELDRSDNRLWIAARKSLVFGGTLKMGDRQALTINGRIYGDGDLLSANFDGRRFTWRVISLSNNNTLKLQRVRFRELDGDADDTQER